jgi:hypothetical protein
MFCLGHSYIEVSVVPGCKEHVILIHMKSMSVTLCKTLNLSHCMPGLQDNYFHILLCCQKPSVTNFSNEHLLISVLNVNLPLLFTVCDVTSSSSHTHNRWQDFFIKQFICKLFLHFSPTVAGRSCSNEKGDRKGFSLQQFIGC